MVDVVKGTPVLVKDLAHVVPGERPVYNIVTANGRPAVLVNVLQQPDGNAVQIADAVNSELARDSQDAAARHSTVDLLRPVHPGAGIHFRRGGEHPHRTCSFPCWCCWRFLKNWRTTIVAAVVIPDRGAHRNRLHAALPHELQPDDAGRHWRPASAW